MEFPNVMGCTGGRHIPTKAGSLFYNYKPFFFSVVLQGVADSESRFTFIDLGAFGKQNDCGTFSRSTLYHFLEDLKSTLSLQVLREVEQNCLPSSLGSR
jgi:hypothetical protein